MTVLDTAYMTLERNDGYGPTIQEWALYEGVRLRGPHSHAARDLAALTLRRLDARIVDPGSRLRNPAARRHRRWLVRMWMSVDL